MCLKKDAQKKAFEIIRANLKEKGIENISINDNLDNIQVDSITFIKIVVSLETAFNFEFEDEMLVITKFSTFKTIIEYVESQINASIQ